MPKIKQTHNPFLNLEIQVGTRKKKTILSGDLKEIQGNLKSREVIDEYDWDLSSFTKIYQSLKGVDVLLTLSRPAMALYILIPHLLKPGDDWVELRSSYLEKKLNLSETTILGAIRDLVGATVLLRKQRSHYWINPTIFFNGDRIHYYKKNKGNIKFVSKTQLSLDLFDYDATKSSSGFSNNAP